MRRDGTPRLKRRRRDDGGSGLNCQTPGDLNGWAFEGLERAGSHRERQVNE